MIDRLKRWYRSRTDATKAALRTFWQAVYGATFVLIIATLTEALDVLNGSTAADAVADLSVAVKAWCVAIVSATIGVASYLRNRVGKTKARYD